VTWWKKEGDPFRGVMHEPRPKLGREARLEAQVEAADQRTLTNINV